MKDIYTIIWILNALIWGVLPAAMGYFNLKKLAAEGIFEIETSSKYIKYWSSIAIAVSLVFALLQYLSLSIFAFFCIAALLQVIFILWVLFGSGAIHTSNCLQIMFPAPINKAQPKYIKWLALFLIFNLCQGAFYVYTMA